MLFTEWNLDDALAVRYEEGREEGIGIGLEKVFSLLEQGISLAEAKEKLGLKSKDVAKF